MLIRTKALVLKEQNIGEYDKLLTLLTCDRGILRAFVKIAGKSKSSLQSASQMLCYGEYSINLSEKGNRIREAQALEVYLGLRRDVEKVALAQYFTQLISEASPDCGNSDELLRILLNALYFLHNSSKNKNMLKAIVEFRTVCAGGYAPNLDGCPICGKSESESFILDYIGGAIYCGDCKNSFSAPHAKLNPSVLSALRYIMMSPVDKLFSFSLSDENFALLSEITEGYAINQLQRRFSALDFYKTASAL